MIENDDPDQAAVQERAERLQTLQQSMKADIRAKHGRDLTPEEITATTRRIVKGKE